MTDETPGDAPRVETGIAARAALTVVAIELPGAPTFITLVSPRVRATAESAIERGESVEHASSAPNDVMATAAVAVRRRVRAMDMVRSEA